MSLGKLKKGLFATAAAGVLALGIGSVPTDAGAAPFTLTGGGQTWHFTNWETRVTDVGQELQGLIRVDNIFKDSNGNEVFSTTPAEEIVGYFRGLTVKNIDESPGGSFAFTSGFIALYRDTTPDFNPSLDATVGSGLSNLATESPGVADIDPDPTPSDVAPIVDGDGVGAGVTDGVLWALIRFDTGISITDPTATLTGSIRAIPPNPVIDDGYGSPALQGDGSAFLSIVAGEVFEHYDTNEFVDLFGGEHDFRLDNTFFITNGPASIPLAPPGCPGPLPGCLEFDNTTNGWDTHSDDPVKSVGLPEPMTSAIFGMGLLGMAGVMRRRRKTA